MMYSPGSVQYLSCAVYYTVVQYREAYINLKFDARLLVCDGTTLAML